MYAAFFALFCLAALLPARRAEAVACTVSSATITYAADDYFYFYINGNEVVNGTTFDAGAPPVTVSIPVGDFAAAGGTDYFAFEVRNSVADLVSADFLIAVTCVGGDVTYITPQSLGLKMYDDTAGTAAPPAESGLNWYQSGYPDSTGLFSGAPTNVTAAQWYAPLTDPDTGAAIPIISFDASAVQDSTGQTLYFAAPMVLPTPPPTPTPYPTVCGAVPAYVQSSLLGTGCAGNGTATSYDYTVPSDPGEVLLVHVEVDGFTLAGATYGGVAMTALPGSPVANGGADIYTFYMVNPPAGTAWLNFGAVSGCSWNVEAAVYDNVNTASPIGTTTSSTGAAYLFTDTINTVGPYSIIDDFIAYANGPYALALTDGTQLFNDASSGCCDAVYGAYENVQGPNTYHIYYSQTTSPSQTWWGVTTELKAVTACGTPTFTQTRTYTPTLTKTDTSTYTETSTDTLTPVSTPTFTQTKTDTVTSTPTPTVTFTDTLTRTPTPTVSFTSTVTYTPTPTRTSTVTSTPTPSVTVTDTPTVTSTVTDTASRTATPTESVTMTATPTVTVTSTATMTRTMTASPTATLTITNSPPATFTDTPTASPTLTASPTKTVTMSDTVTYTVTSTPTPTSTVTVTRSFTDTYTMTASPTATLTITNSPPASLTDTPTKTDTSTATPTSSDTLTHTDTYTVTFTPTPTLTSTPSRTFTDTFTVTATPTATLSFTPSPPASATVSPTNSPTMTSSPTRTASPSVTLTYTFTATPSSTATRTASPTATLSFTASPPASATDTPTASPTATITLTATPSPTVTVTITDSPPASATVTYTITLTRTPSATPTISPSLTDTPSISPSPTQSPVDSATLTLTYSSTRTASPSSTASPTVTLTLTYSLTYTSTYTVTESDTPTFGSSPTDSVTLTSSLTSTLSDTRTDSPTLTATPTPSSTLTASPSSTATATATPTLTITATFSESPTAVTYPMTASVDVYNSAGELVASVYNGPASNPVNQVLVSVLPPPAGGSGCGLPVQVGINGLGGPANNLVWNGTNQNGQAVQNGVYYVKVSMVNAFGQVTAVTDPVNVLGSPCVSSLEIYNSAGEVVDTLDISSLPSPAVGMSLELPNGKTGITASPDPKSPSPTGGVVIDLALQSGVVYPVYWSGLSASGQPLQSGTYMVALTQSEATSSQMVKTLTLTLLGTQNLSVQAMAASAYVVPNPVPATSSGFTVEYQGNGADAVVGELYDLAGERVAQASQGPTAGQAMLRFDVKLSGGVYLLDFEVADNTVPLARHVLKVAVVR